ncbi:WEB family protein At3g02930, chloroplastic-like isoform X2 [Amaranthus tricolor]|uniref:WEB family protein At3g02930, chloroplastic-like isoform X2 n=1 Tax=Amaranthus tricolor TaxID=29722 RepID=UPI00258CC0C6|nr:WEB family protein At3g02930, chloroplastic-like isoform X2 [Amaranthus tricolor]
MGRSGLSDTPSSKTGRTTPRVAKLGKPGSLKSDADSPSLIPNPRLSIDRTSPRSVTSKPTITRTPIRLSTPEKPQSRILKPSELQAQLLAAQDDLKKAKETLLLYEKEKNQALNELKDAKKQADEANEKLQEALVAQKRAEDTSEIEKFRAVELEQAGIEAAQKKDEEWKKELEALRSQNAADKTALLAAAEELQRAKQELAMVTDAKNLALSHADDATMIAELHAKKVETLSAELAKLKGLLESNANDGDTENGIVVELRSELSCLRQELEKAKNFEQELVKKENSSKTIVGGLRSEIETLKEELDAVKACKEGMVEKEKSYEKVVTELKSEIVSREDEIEKIKTHEQDLIHKEKSYEKMIEELKIELGSLREELKKQEAFKEELINKEESRDRVISERDFEIDSLKKELENAKSFEGQLAEKTSLYDQTVTELKSEIDLLNHELEKAEILNAELLEREKLNEVITRNCETEMHSLRQKLESAKGFQETLVEKEEAYEQLNVELEAARMAESYALNLLDECKKRAEELENKVAESNRLERSASESLESIMKQLAGNSDMLHEAECEISALKEKVSLLEISLEKKKTDSEESENRLQKANEEVRVVTEKLDSLRSGLEIMSEEKAQALENEKLAACNVQDLLEEKNKLINELDTLKEEEEKSKKAMESLASALHEVSAEAREAKESLLSSRAEHENFEMQIEHLQLVLKGTSENYEAVLEDSKREIDQLKNTVEQSKVDFDTQMEDLKVVLKASNEKYENMLDESNQEIDRLSKEMEQSKLGHQNEKAKWEVKEMELKNRVKTLEDEKSTIKESGMSYEDAKVEWEQKELQLVNSVKRSEEEKSSMEKEIIRLVHLLREAEEKACAAREEGSQLRNSLGEAMSESVSLKEARDEAEGETLKLKDALCGKENELQIMIRENEQLWAAEDANAWKIDELTKLLEEAKSYQRTKENGELSDSDKEYDMLPKVVEFSEENGHTSELPSHENKGVNGVSEGDKNVVLAEAEAENTKPTSTENKEQAHDDSPESDIKMWGRDVSTEMEAEQVSVDDEVDYKAERGESVDLMNEISSDNGANSDLKQKKKKPLYRKFGNLLKKGMSNQK